MSDLSQSSTLSAARQPLPTGSPGQPGLKEIWHHPLALQSRAFTRVLCRLVTAWSTRHIVEIRGVNHIAPERDPFILALNHNQRWEAVLVPTRLIYHRQGRLLHFLADWNFLLMPGVATLYRRSGVITVTRKDARPRFLNALRPLFSHALPARQRALDRLRAGASVGVFPEGTINRHPHRLLRGSTGTAQLALRSGASIVPAGIRFPEHRGSDPITDGERMIVEIGEPIEPPTVADRQRPRRGELRELHQQIMLELAKLSGKSWSPRAQKRR